METESLEDIAERLGWSAERLAQARAQAAEPRPTTVTERDLARAQALSEAVKQTTNALEQAS